MPEVECSLMPSFITTSRYGRRLTISGDGMGSSSCPRASSSSAWSFDWMTGFWARWKVIAHRVLASESSQYTVEKKLKTVNISLGDGIRASDQLEDSFGGEFRWSHGFPFIIFPLLELAQNVHPVRGSPKALRDRSDSKPIEVP